MHKGVIKLVLTGLFLSVALTSGHVIAKETPGFATDSVVSLNSLPPQARTTYQLVLQGGPFPYDKDGSVFGNRERLLPLQTRGFYREYTVKTPGERSRGARRIVCGGEEPRLPKQCFYTQDHYASFREIVMTP